VELDKKKYTRGLSPVTQTEMNTEEAQRYLAAYADIVKTVEDANNLVPRHLQDAYFAAVLYPVSAASAMARKVLSDAPESHQAYEDIQRLTARYQQMKDGKWRGLMDAAPRRLPVFEDVHAQLTDNPVNIPIAVVRQGNQYDGCTGQTTSVSMLGHSMGAVSLSKDGQLNYSFNVAEAGDYTLTTALIPTHPVDSGDLRYSVSIDGGTPTVFSLKEPFRSERWKQNVLRGQARRTQQVHLSAGRHTLTLTALDEHIVVDQWWLDAHAERHCYLAPVAE